MSKKIIISCLGLVFGVLIFGFISSPSIAQQKTVRIGGLWPLSGPFAHSARFFVNAEKMAVDEINAAGGIKSLGGAKIELILGDHQANPETSLREAERLIKSENVVIIQGTFVGSCSITAAQICEKLNVPLLSTVMIDSLTESGFKYTFRNESSSRGFSKATVDFLNYINLKSNNKIRKVAIVWEDGSWGTETYKHQERFAKEKGLESVSFSFHTGTKTMSPIINKVQAARADAILLTSYMNDEILMFRGMKTVNLNMPIIVIQAAFYTEDVISLGELVEGNVGVVAWAPDVYTSEHNKIFTKNYKARFNEEPNENSGYVYSGIYIIKDALERAATTNPIKLRDALASTRITSGPAMIIGGNEIAFDERGQAHVPFFGMQIQDGKYVTVWPEDVAAGKMRMVWNWEQK